MEVCYPYFSMYKQWDQNKKNQLIRGSLQNIIKNNHPNVFYTEADMSSYNPNEYTYMDLAVDLGLDLGHLFEGPIVVLMHDEVGYAYYSGSDTLRFLRHIDKQLNYMETQLYGTSKPLSNVRKEYYAVNQFYAHEPYENYNYYRPKNDEESHEAKKQQVKSPHTSTGAEPITAPEDYIPPHEAPKPPPEPAKPAPVTPPPVETPPPAPTPVNFHEEPEPSSGFSLDEPSKTMAY
jgi:hypothetical protein